MSKKSTKKKIILWVLLIIFILLLVGIAVPITILYVQYRNICYVPFLPVARSDTYVVPEYPEVTPGSEGITDFPDATESPEESVDEASKDTEADTQITEAETTAPQEVTEETNPTETHVTTETVSKAPVISRPDIWSTNLIPDFSTNSFSNSANAVSVYGRTPIYKVNQKDKDIINILVMGTDTREVVKERGRSDSMIVVSYNKETGKIKMVSLMRDMLVPIEGYDCNRINAAYSFDGAGLAINTVNQVLDLDIQYFVVVDLNGAKDFIDHIGGIELTLSEAEAKVACVYYSPDPVLLDGYSALLHMRNRMVDNDFGRTERQREVIVAVFNKIIKEKSLTEILDIIKYAMGMVKTNIPAATLTSLAASIIYNVSNLSIESQNIPYKDAFQYAWYKKKAILSFDIDSTAERVLNFLYE